MWACTVVCLCVKPVMDCQTLQGGALSSKVSYTLIPFSPRNPELDKARMELEWTNVCQHWYKGYLNSFLLYLKELPLYKNILWNKAFGFCLTFACSCDTLSLIHWGSCAALVEFCVSVWTEVFCEQIYVDVIVFGNRGKSLFLKTPVCVLRLKHTNFRKNSGHGSKETFIRKCLFHRSCGHLSSFLLLLPEKDLLDVLHRTQNSPETVSCVVGFGYTLHSSFTFYKAPMVLSLKLPVMCFLYGSYDTFHCKTSTKSPGSSRSWEVACIPHTGKPQKDISSKR